jgi:hypothetical protein
VGKYVEKFRKNKDYQDEYNFRDEEKRQREKKRDKKFKLRDTYMFTAEDESLPRKKQRY